MNLKGKTVVVTGAGSGLGLGTCQVLSAAGARIAAFDINGRSAAAVEKAFHLTALRPEDEVYLEASSATDRDRWVAALDELIHVAKTWPTKLTPHM